ncbi:MAG: V-type ATP synthase subunit D [Chloroflexi bacterium]|nr:V-type ATP synthase subunit D [Chloroflexota bacterium]
MAKSNVPPTRSNLIRIKHELTFAREGYEILDRKRDVLAKELVRMAEDAQKVQEEMEKLFAAAYVAQEKAKLLMGREHVEWAALAVHKTIDIQVKFRGVMGVSLPIVEARGEPPELTYSPGDTTATLDEASALFREVLARLTELSRLVTSVWRLAVELRKTQRRVNALEFIFIPDYVETITFIESSLEEREREEIFRLKLLKSRSAKAAGLHTVELDMPHPG